MTPPDVSVVIPARNEAENLPLLIEEIEAAMADIPHEIIVVDDGSTDATAQVVRALEKRRPQLRLVRHAASFRPERGAADRRADGAGGLCRDTGR